MIKFGVAGNSLSFYSEGHSSTMEAANWCREKGIEIFEYSFGKGILLGSKSAQEIGTEFIKNNIEMSVHAPYYINYANKDPEMIEKSIDYVVRSLQRLQDLNCGDRVVVHPASQGKLTREDAVSTTIDNLKKLSDTLEFYNLTNFKVCLETMGKIGQIGDLKEIAELVNLSPYFYPCIDFGHLNARTIGSIKGHCEYKQIIDYMFDNLPEEKVINTHIHFSKIMYGQKGEIKHLTFQDNEFGPNFEPLLEVITEKKLSPKIICESDGTQAEDAITMKKYYLSINRNI